MTEYTHFLTLNYKKGIHGNRGDAVVYETAHRSYIYSLSKSISSKSIWRRYKPILKTSGILDQGDLNHLPHSHICIRFPDHYANDLERLIIKARTIAHGNHWFLRGKYSFDLIPYDADIHRPYLLKKETRSGPALDPSSIYTMRGTQIITG